MSLNPNDWNQVGLITFKDLVDVIKNKRLKYPVPVIFGNIGGVTGSNEFQNCDLLYIIGQNHRAPDYCDDIIVAAEKYIDDFKETPEFAIGYDPILIENAKLPEWDSRTIQDHELARDLIQTIGRGCNRRVIDNKGNCKPSTVRITMDENYALASFLERKVRENFHKVEYIDRGWRFIKESNLDAIDFDKDYDEGQALKMIALQKSSNNHEAAINWFHYSGLTKKTIFSIAMQLGLAKTHANKIRNALTNGDGKYKKLMDELGIRVDKLPNAKGNMSWFLVKESS